MRFGTDAIFPLSRRAKALARSRTHESVQPFPLRSKEKGCGRAHTANRPIEVARLPPSAKL